MTTDASLLLSFRSPDQDGRSRSGDGSGKIAAPKVSIIVPVYNMERYLRKCLDSLIRQTLKDIEIVVVNDESADASPEIIAEYAERDDRIKVVNRKNGGLSMARNSGMSVATGEYVGFVDADDWVEIEMFEKMYEMGNRHSADIVICDYNRVFVEYVEESRLRIETEVIDMNALGMNRYFDQYLFPYRHGDEAWNKIYKREFLQDFGIVFEKNSEVFSEDKLFNLYCLLNVKKICTIDAGFYNYLQREGSIMYKVKPDYTKRLMTLLERFRKAAQFHGRQKDIEPVLGGLILQVIGNAVFDKLRVEGLGLFKVREDLKNVNDFHFFKSSMRKVLTASGSLKERLYSFLLYTDSFILFLFLKKIAIGIKEMKRGLRMSRPTE
ncbi:MAG TPA: glycosyltransferase [Syntrophales bacterium]|nr:glycosyltransferase [Syntrophales bacterium]